MKPIAKLYFKVFTVFALIFGLSVITFAIIIGIGFKLKFLLHSMIFGFLFSLILVSIQKKKLKAIGIDHLSDENLAVNQNKTILSNLKLDQLLTLLKNEPYFSNMKFVKSNIGITLNSGANFKSLGENIDIKFNQHIDGQNKFLVTSKPRIKGALLDYGKNLDNVNRILNLIKYSA